MRSMCVCVCVCVYACVYFVMLECSFFISLVSDVWFSPQRWKQLPRLQRVVVVMVAVGLLVGVALLVTTYLSGPSHSSSLTHTPQPSHFSYKLVSVYQASDDRACFAVLIYFCISGITVMPYQLQQLFFIKMLWLFNFLLIGEFDYIKRKYWLDNFNYCWYLMWPQACTCHYTTFTSVICFVIFVGLIIAISKLKVISSQPPFWWPPFFMWSSIPSHLRQSIESSHHH